MHRRRFLAGVVTATAVAGCSGSDSSTDEDADGGGDESESRPSYDVTGEILDDEPFEAVSLGATTNDDNTLTVSGELRYTGDGTVVLTGLFCNYYDTEGRGMLSSSSSLESEPTVGSDETVSVEVQTDEFDKADVENVGSFEVIVSTRPA
jgi:hypothetical protein